MLNQARTWVASIIPLLLLSLAAIAAQPALAQTDDATAAAARAVTWLVTTHQNADGGYASFSAGADAADSDINGTLDALLAIASTGRVPVRTVAYLEENATALADYAATGGGEAGKTVLALTAIEQDPRAFAGNDFVATLTGFIGEDGQIAATPYNQALALLGLAAAGEAAPEAAVQWLLDLQATEGEIAGSWDDGFGTSGNVDATAMAVMALLAVDGAGAEDAVADALDFIAGAQRAEGGWAYADGFDPNANSTALALQALTAAGQDTAEAQAALTGYIGETGAFQADFGEGPADDFFTTVQALPALVGQPYPVGTSAAVDESADAAAEPETVDEPADEEPALDPEEVDAAAEPEPAPTPAPTPEPAPESAAADTGGEARFWFALAGLAVFGGLIAVIGLRMGRP